MSNHDMEKDYVVLPRISSIEVNRLGCIHHAQMEFKDKITVISTAGADGISTLVHAFRIIRGQPVINSLDPSYSPVQEPIDPDFSIKYTLKEPQAIIRHLIEQPTPAEIFHKYSTSQSQKIKGMADDGLLKISKIFYTLREDLCLVLDKDLIDPLPRHYAEAVFDLILNTPAQVIVFLGANDVEILSDELRPFWHYELIEDEDGFGSTISSL